MSVLINMNLPEYLTHPNKIESASADTDILHLAFCILHFDEEKPMEEIVQLPEGDVEVIDIQFRPGQKIYYFDPDGVVYYPGDHVIMDTARGAE